MGRTRCERILTWTALLTGILAAPASVANEWPPRDVATMQAALAGARSSSRPPDGFVGVYADAAGTEACASIPVGQVGTLYVLGTPPEAELPGYRLAEFRIEITHPAGYLFAFTPSPEAVVWFGNPLDTAPADPNDPSGTAMAFNTCQAADRVLVGTIAVLNMSGGPTELRVKRHSWPSNPFVGNCPLFTDCDPPYYTMRCMKSCDVDPAGSAIASRAFLNTSPCAPAACAASCTPAPCITLTASTSPPACPGEPRTITATATNCGTLPEDVDLFVDELLVGSFADVPPAGNVTASHTFTPSICSSNGTSHDISGIARNDVCASPLGAEVWRAISCRSDCANNRPPDCSQATPTVETLWPPDGTMRDVSIQGVTDPDGDPVNVTISVVGSDEPTGIYGANCPDATVEGPNAVRLRAERDPNGNGRVYRLTYRGSDPHGAECNELMTICVPRKLDMECTAGHFGYTATACDAPTTRRSIHSPEAVPIDNGQVGVRFTMPVADDADIIVYDMRGRRVQDLARSRFVAGRHLVIWDGRSATGARVAAGIYLVRLRTGSTVESVKVVLAR